MRVPGNLPDIVHNSLTKLVGLSHYELYLFGSRTKDHLGGGDIDLLIVVESLVELTRLEEKKLDLLVDVKKSLGDRRIDLLFHSKDGSTSEFVKNILSSAVLLKAV